MTHPMKSVRSFIFFLGAIFLVATFSGCAQKVQLDAKPVFFPPPPNPPRIQYLTSISGAKDIEGEKKSFALVVIGGKKAAKEIRFIKPYGITTANGKIYICDMGLADVIAIDPDQKTLTGIKGNYNVGKLKKPVNVALDAEGRMYVADILRREVVVYSPQGDFVAGFGKELDMKPADVAVDDERIYVLDIKGNEIKVLDRKTGKYLESIGKETDGLDRLSIPTNMHMSQDGNLYVTNVGTGRVMKLDRDGHLLLTFGQLGDVVGQFARPKGIAVDDENRIFVVDGGHQNVQVFNDDARLLIFFGDPGLMRGSLNLPTSIAVSKDNLEHFQKFADPTFELEELVYVVNQYGDDKISVYGLGHQKGAAKPSAE